MIKRPKNFRLDETLRQAFESECRESLLNETDVIEAMIVWFLNSTPEQRRTLAKTKLAWLAKKSQKK